MSLMILIAVIFISSTDNNMDVPCESVRANFKTKLKNNDRNYKRGPSSLETLFAPTLNDELITKSIYKPQKFVANVTGCCYDQTVATTPALVITIC